MNDANTISDCRSAMARLFELLDGELTPEVELKVRTHLDSCRACFTHADFEKRFLAAVHAARAEGIAPKACRERVMSALRTAGFTG